MPRISSILGSNPCYGTNIRQWVRDVRIFSFLNHIHIRLKEKTVEKSLFFHRHCIHRHFIMTFEMIFGAKNLLHHVMITHVRALAISSSKQPPLPCNYGRWLGAQFLCKKKSFPNYARTKPCACNSEVISSVEGKVEMPKYIHLQKWFFFQIWFGKCFAIRIHSSNICLYLGLDKT